MRQSKSVLMKKFLYLNWLRPENVIFNVGRSFPLQKYHFESPSLDIGCGDGLFSFVTAGGTLAKEFDRFKFIIPDGFYRNKDIHENYRKDMYEVPIIEEPHYKFDFGTDWKNAMLEKADKIGFYSKLRLHDSNKKFDFFENDFFKTIYCNIAYWLENIEGFMQEMHRILMHNGSLYLQVITERIDFAYSNLNFGKEWFSIIDRGRYELYKTFKTKDYWASLIKKGGFKINAIIPTFSNLQAKIWDIGLRPIVPYLIEMSNLLTKKDRERIKFEYCQTMEKLINPFVLMQSEEGKAVDFLFVLTK